MNSQQLTEVITCSICFELFGEDKRCPRIITCGHTFCHSCLEKILLQSPSCPTCKAHIQAQAVEFIPINFIAKNLVPLVKRGSQSGRQHISLIKIPVRLESERLCIEHSYFNELRCMDCETWICAMCGMLHHKQCKTLLLQEVYRELKEVVSQKVVEELEARKFVNDDISLSLESLEKEREKLDAEMKEKETVLKECEMKIGKLQSLHSKESKFSENLREILSAVESASLDNELSSAVNKLEELMVLGEMLSLQLATLDVICSMPVPSRQELMALCESQSIYVVENGDEILYGEVKVRDDQIFISSFQPEKPKGRMFPFRDLLSKFQGFSELPKKAFLESENGDNIIIETDGMSPRAKNFIFLCSGLKGHSYKGRTLIGDDSVDGNSTVLNLFPGPPSVVGIIEGDEPRSKTRGFVTGMSEGNSWFSIILKNYSGCPEPVIGIIKSGFETFGSYRRCVEFETFGSYRRCVEFEINDCGLVI